MSAFDLSLGAKVMAGNWNWQEASISTVLAVLLFGRREKFIHLDKVVTIRWWRDQPYLTAIGEVKA